MSTTHYQSPGPFIAIPFYPTLHHCQLMQFRLISLIMPLSMFYALAMPVSPSSLFYQSSLD
jgi:hypothetical protein